MTTTSKKPPKTDRAKKLVKALGSTEGLKVWSEVKAPPSLRTGITSFNRALDSGGPPGGMLGVVHGPSQGGKTVLVSEILRSAAASGGMALLGDAECRSKDLRWFRAICGDFIDEIAYCKPKTYQHWVKIVEDFRGKFRELKDDGTLPPEAMLAIAIDSIDRLVPEEELEESKKGEMKARGYPLRAMLNDKWFGRILPNLGPDEVLVAVVRESTKLDPKPGQKTYRVRGGKALEFDAGWRVRVTNPSRVKIKVAGNEAQTKIGEKHVIVVEKNSLGPNVDEPAAFYTLSGVTDEHPLGLDRAREVREEAIARKLIKHKGNKHVYEGEEIGTKERIVEWLKGKDEQGNVRLDVIAERLDTYVVKSSANVG